MVRLIAGILLVLLYANTVAAFTMKLIPRYSIHPNNLTESQRIELLIQHSKDYARFADAGSKMLQPIISEKRMLYLVQTSIGTGQGAHLYTLHFDLGSDLTWIQCLPCDPCFRQPSPIFDPGLSTTFNFVSRDHRLCFPPYGHMPDNGICTYLISYYDNTAISGVLAQERFTFVSDRGNEINEVYQGLTFGCTNVSDFPDSDTGDWDGILGMGMSQVSIASQLQQLINYRFSFCLVKPESGLSSFLRFGPEPIREYQRTPIYPLYDSGKYYINLEDISIGTQRLNLPPYMFVRRGPWDGGFIVDTGASVTHLIQPAWDAAKNVLVDLFDGLHLVNVGTSLGLDLCYTNPPSPETDLPGMVFHFEEADYVMPWDNVFVFDTERNIFCWSMLESQTVSLFGARQMANFRFVFNLRNLYINFAPENCGAEVPNA